jgi:hypothetical protein
MRKLTKTRSRVELSLRGYEVQVRTVNEVCQPQ